MKSMRIGLCFEAGVLSQYRYSQSLRSIDVLLFPELVDGGYAALYDGATPRQRDDRLVQTFRDASQEYSMCCIAGSMYYRNRHSPPTNSTLVFNNGRLIYRYDKIHLFKPAFDNQYFHPGHTIDTFTFLAGRKRLRAGIAICYDIRFPELIRTMALGGMQFLFVPARWPAVRDEAWCTLLRARAIENQIFVIGCNALGKEGGYSYAVDPLGGIVFSNRKKQGLQLQTFEIQLDLLTAAKQHHNNLRDAVLLRSHG
jgi:omega-amidase